MVWLSNSGPGIGPVVYGPRGLKRKAAIVRGAWTAAMFPLIVYLELREKFEHTDWKW